MVEVPKLLPFAKDRWLVAEDYVYSWEFEGNRFRITVPQNYITDGVTIPTVASWLIGVTRSGPAMGSALIHDYIYHHKGTLPIGVFQVYRNGGWKNTEGRWRRSETDRLFGRMLRESGISKSQRRIMLFFVWLVGGLFWMI